MVDPVQQNTISPNALTDCRRMASREEMDETEADWFCVRRQARRLITLGCKAGKPWDSAATVGEVARATRLTPERVVQVIRAWGYYMEVAEVPNVGIANWIVWEDGE